MGRGKQSTEGQAQRRQQIIDYIREHGTVKGRDLCEELGMSRSSLSDDIRAINKGGEIVLSPKKGTYTINEQIRVSKNPYSKLDRKSVRRWMILLSLFRRDRTFDEILEYLEKSGKGCSDSTLREDLTALEQDGIVAKVKDGKQQFYHSESIYETDQSEIRQYVKKKGENNSRVGITAFRDIDLKIKHCIPDLEIKSEEDSRIRRSGKHNVLTEEQVQMLQEFEKHPYKEKELVIAFKTNAGQEVMRNICAGIIVYVVETGRIYLIGENKRRKKHASGVYHLIIPMDRIESVSEGRRVNNCYNTPEYHRICREMFQISTEDPMDVCVRFEDHSFIRDKIERLCAVRETARIKIDGDEIIFTDTVRGKGDFARYLRRFGRSAIVEKPASLREDMMNASRKILALYE